MLEEAADPWRALLAARILGLGATPADLEVLLSPAGDRLDAGTTRSSHVLSDLAAHVRTPAHLEVVLAFLADREISSRARVEVLDDLIYADFYLRDTDPEDLSPGADAMRDRFFAWVADEAGRIDLETSEGLMHTLAGRLPEEKAREVIEAMRKAIDAWSAEGPRLRMRERLDELVEELEES